MKKQLDCAYCGKTNLSRNEIGLNKKLIHRQVERMMCLACLSKALDIGEDELHDLIERLKLQGCSLFG
jgi:hypothetical protein